MQEELAAEPVRGVVCIVCNILGPPCPDMQLGAWTTGSCVGPALALQLYPQVVRLAIAQLVNLQVSLQQHAAGTHSRRLVHIIKGMNPICVQASIGAPKSLDQEL